MCKNSYIVDPSCSISMQASSSNSTPNISGSFKVVSSTLPSPSTLVPQQNVTVSGESCASWLTQLKIPWNKCRPTIFESLAKDEPPSACDLRDLVNNTMSDVMKYTRRASRAELRFFARQIV